MTHQELKGNFLTSNGWILGTARFNQRLISILPNHLADHERIIIPGFIDCHVHGGMGFDFMEGGDAALNIAKLHAKFGTTSMLATTMTATKPEIEHALSSIAQLIGKPVSKHANILGTHLEGPYINPTKLGAQPNDTALISIDDIDYFHQIAPIKAITLAPEICDDLSCIQKIIAMGIRVQIGHSNATYEQCLDAMHAGASSFTHLFNAMSGLHHRNPGVVGAALAHAQYAEVIPDLIHVHPGGLQVARRSIPKLYAVTDATAACAMPEGEYFLGRQKVFQCQGCVRLATGELAGSKLTMFQAFKNLISMGFDIPQCSEMLSGNPASYLNLSDRGRIETGAWVDWVVMDRDLEIQDVLIAGDSIF